MGGRVAPWPMPQPLRLQIPGGGQPGPLVVLPPPPPPAAVPGPVHAAGEAWPTHPTPGLTVGEAEALPPTRPWLGAPGVLYQGLAPLSPEPSSQAPQASAKQVEQRRGRVRGGGRYPSWQPRGHASGLPTGPPGLGWGLRAWKGCSKGRLPPHGGGGPSGMFPDPSAGECGGCRDTQGRWAPPRGASSSRWGRGLEPGLRPAEAGALEQNREGGAGRLCRGLCSRGCSLGRDSRGGG